MEVPVCMGSVSAGWIWDTEELRVGKDELGAS